MKISTVRSFQDVEKDKEKKMKFSIDSKDFTAAVLSVIKALPSKASMPLLEGVFIEAKEHQILLKCSDLMMQKEASLDADIEEDGAVILPGKLLSEICRKLPDETLDFSLEDNSVMMKCGRSRSRLQIIPFEPFPDMIFRDNYVSVTMKPDQLKEMISGTVFATSQDDSKPILMGVLMETEGNTVTMVATDAFQFAMRKEKTENELSSSSIVIPAKTLQEIGHMSEESQDDLVSFSFTDTHIRVQVNRSSLTARLLEGDYIDYRRILPKESTTRVMIDRNELLESIDRAQLMARDDSNSSIVMNFSENMLKITALSSAGTANESIPAQISGEDLEIAFNPRYCMNILRAVPDENIYMDFTTNISPCVLKPSSGDQYYYLIVPVRIYSQF